MVDIKHSNILELYELRKHAFSGGGDKRIELQHQRGKLTARERLQLLLDEGSFEEIDSLKVGRGEMVGGNKSHPGDGVITGHGTIEAAVDAMKLGASLYASYCTTCHGSDARGAPGYPNLTAFNRALANHVLTHPTLSFEPEGHATRRGRHTRDLLMDEKGPVAILEDAVIRAVDGYLQRRTPVADHPFPGPVPRRHRLTMWAVVMETEGYQLPHIHPSAWLSGVYYVQLPETLGSRQEDAAGWIEFGLAPDELRSSPDMPVRLVEPVEGRMYLFPSYLYHRTIPFPGDHRRISIAFDVLRRPAG